MKRSCLMPYAAAWCVFAAAIVAGCLFTSVSARADIRVRIDIGNAPPPPHFVFLRQPHERRYPGDAVYFVDDPGVGDYDCFHYQGYYWVFRDGYWYRSAGWRGPFVVFDPRYVPTVFYREPPVRWKHHPSGPPVFTDRSGGVSPRMTQSVGRSPHVVRNTLSRRPAEQKSGRGGSMAHAKKSDGSSKHVKNGKGNDKGNGKGNGKGNDNGGGHGGK